MNALRSAGVIALVSLTTGFVFAQTGGIREDAGDVPRTPVATQPRPPSAASPRVVIDSFIVRSVDTVRAGDVPYPVRPAAADSVSLSRYTLSVNIAAGCFLFWLFLVLFYFVWAIRRYVYNYGLSSKEWKILYPEAYETPFDRLFQNLVRRPLGLPSYGEIRKSLLDEKIRAHMQSRAEDDASPLPELQPLDEPSGNPYQKDSFGLPPGTIRGTLALTALVMFLLVEGVNLFAPINLEHEFDNLITALQMVLAFYFGSRAVEVLQTRSAEPKPASLPGAKWPQGVTGHATVPPATPVATSTVSQAIEQPVMPSRASEVRFLNASFHADDSPAHAGTLSVQSPLPQRVLALTASFETGKGFPGCFAGLTGNFDAQGVSFGALQWNIGQGSLQPLFLEMQQEHEQEMQDALGASQYNELTRVLRGTRADQMAWAQKIQFPLPNKPQVWKIVDAWSDALQRLGATGGMIEIQVRHAAALYETALANCSTLSLTTERAVALMFDIRVQNGTLDRNGVGARIRQDYDLLSRSLSADELEVERMRIVARRRSGLSSQRWQADVLSRKLTIAEGSGKVHGKEYELASEFALALRPFAALQAGVVTA